MKNHPSPYPSPRLRAYKPTNSKKLQAVALPLGALRVKKIA